MTGVQTCALPIFYCAALSSAVSGEAFGLYNDEGFCDVFKCTSTLYGAMQGITVQRRVMWFDAFGWSMVD